METETTPAEGCITVSLNVVVDATDLINENGRERAQHLVRLAIDRLREKIEDLLAQELVEIERVPVAVRDVDLVPMPR